MNTVLFVTIPAFFQILAASSPLVLATFVTSSSSKRIPWHLAPAIFFTVVATWFWHDYAKQIPINTGGLNFLFWVVAVCGMLVVALRRRNSIAGVGWPFLIWILWCVIVALASVAPNFPFASAYNNDLWNYLKISNLTAFGSSENNIVGCDLRAACAPGSLDQTVLAMLVLSGLASFWHTIPAAIYSGAVVGLVWIGASSLYLVLRCRPYLLSRSRAGLVALAWTLSGCLYLVIGFSFFAQLTGYVLTTTVLCVCLNEETSYPSRALTLVLLFYLIILAYTLAFIAASSLVCILGVSSAVMSRKERSARIRPLSMVITPFGGVALMSLVNPNFLSMKVKEIAWLSNAPVGWNYDLLNPLTFLVNLGVPPHLRFGVSNWVLQSAMLAVLVATFVASMRSNRLAGFGQWRGGKPADPILLVTIAAILIYLGFFLKVGPSYQQWKVAAALVGPAAIGVLIQMGQSKRRLGRIGLVLVCVIGAVAFEAVANQRKPAFAAYATIEEASTALSRMPGATVHFILSGMEPAMVAAQLAGLHKTITLYAGTYYGAGQSPPTALALLGGIVVTDRCGELDPQRTTPLAMGYCYQAAK